jgi:mono/diheme cytochrome c family protein
MAGGMTRLARLVSCAAATVALAACSRQAPPESGEVLYQRYCASCHGAEGRGDGPAAAGKTPKATDLTTTEPDVPHLMQVIDGRVTVEGHGTSAMPVWGNVFQQVHDDPHTQRKVLLDIQALAEYVASLASGGAETR